MGTVVWLQTGTVGYRLSTVVYGGYRGMAEYGGIDTCGVPWYRYRLSTVVWRVPWYAGAGTVVWPRGVNFARQVRKPSNVLKCLKVLKTSKPSNVLKCLKVLKAKSLKKLKSLKKYRGTKGQKS